MTNTTVFNKKQVMKYLIFTFGIAWIMQGAIAVLYKAGHTMIGQLLMAVMMFVPLFGVMVSGFTLKDIGWRPHIKRNIGSVLIAWFIPAALTVMGAALYFALFPSHFDMSGSYLIENISEDALKQLEAQGITYPIYILVTSISCVTYAPLINMLFAMGEETGWRGFLYPQLTARFGKIKGYIIGGIIWGCWHWPVIWLIGYEYGTDYIGFPIVGMLEFCVITVAIGIICAWLYERSECIWIPAIFHGAFNAAATVPLVVTIQNTASMRLLGPAPNGLLSGLPIILLSLILLKGLYKREYL